MFPFARSVESVVRGEADLHVPILRNPLVDVAQLPYRFASEPMGVVTIVLYSNAARPLSIEQIEAALGAAEPFPYRVESIRGTAEFGTFPARYADSVEQGLRKTAAGRIDAFFSAQEDADHVLRRLKLKGIHRSPYRRFDDVIVIAKGPAGDAVDRILSQAIRALKQRGVWDALYREVHRPYEDWQPSQQDW